MTFVETSVHQRQFGHASVQMSALESRQDSLDGKMTEVLATTTAATEEL
jgi:hypothetical protein